MPIKEIYSAPKEKKPLILTKTFWGGKVDGHYYELGYILDKHKEKETVFIEIPEKYDPAINKPEDKLKILKQIDIPEKFVVLKPPPKIPYWIPFAEITWQDILNTTLEDCYVQVRAHIQNYWTDETEDYDILATWVILTYLHEKLDVFPQIWVYGPQSSGKTRLLELLSSISYHGIMSSHITIAALATLTEDAKITLFLDETENLNQKDNPDLWNFVLTRYKKGQYYICKNKDSGAVDMQACWGFTCFAGRDRPNEPLGSRCLLIIAKKQLGVPTSEDYIMSEKLRQMMSFLKIADVLMSYSPSQKSIKDMKDMYMIHLQDIKNSGMCLTNIHIDRYDRTDEIIQPLAILYGCMKSNVLHVLHVLNPIFLYLQKRKKEQQGEESTMIDAEIVEAIDFYMVEHAAENPSSVDITDIVNATRKDKEKYASRTIGKIITRLGYKQSSTHCSKRRYIIDEKQHIHNKKRFGLIDDEDIIKPSQTSPEQQKLDPVVPS